MKINNNYVIKKVLDSDVIINIKSNTDDIIKLNKTSKDICDCVLNNMKIEEIVNYLLDKYDVDIDVAKKDVDNFVNEMIHKGIFIDE